MTRETEMFIKKLNLFIFKKYLCVIAKEEMLWFSNINSPHQYDVTKYNYVEKKRIFCYVVIRALKAFNLLHFYL